MARGGGDDLTTIVVLGAAGYAAYKSGLLCNLWPGAPCPSGGTGGGCTPACVAPQTCVNGTCQNPSPQIWNVADITLYFLESVQPVTIGQSVDALVSFVYTGPGGLAQFGFTVYGDSCPTGITFQNAQSVQLAPASTPTDVSVPTTGLVWPAFSALCFVACGLGVITYNVQPFVTVGGQRVNGPVYSNGVLTC